MASPGNYSLRLRHPPEVPHVSGTDASHYFSLGGDYSEITLEWDWYVPNNFAMRFVGSGAKMFRMWSTVYDERSKVGMSFHALDGDYNPDNAVMYLNRNEGGGMGADWSNPIPWINSSNHGTWMAIKHVAIAPTVSSQGYTAMYKDGILMAEGYWDNYDPNLGKNLYSKGYMGGWCSPGYDEQTDFYIDNFRITSGTVVVDPPPIIGDKTDLDLIRWYADFTNYSDGTSVETAGLASSNAIVSSTKLLNGKKSARDTITGGDTDVWGECGFLKDFSADSIGEGDEVWFRMYTYYPTGFSFNTPGQGDTLSFMRQRNVNGTNPAVTIKVSRQNGQTTSEYDGRWQLIADNSGVGPWPLTTDNSFDIIHNKWEAWELYVKYSSNATLGKVRFYKDGIQIGPETSLKTLNELDDPTIVMYHMWWDGAVPQDQEFYFALPAVAVKSSSRDDTLYMSRDTEGNPIIGLEVDSTPIDPDGLLAPSNFRVTGYGTDYIDYAWDYNGSGQGAFSLDTSVGLNNFQRYTDSISPIARTYRVTASPNTYTGGRIKATSTSAPDPVTDLSGVAIGSTIVRLSWTAVLGVDMYTIQRAPNNGLWTDVDTTTGTTFDDIGLAASSTYQHRIFTSTGGVWGAVSNVVSTTTNSDTLPVAGEYEFMLQAEDWNVGQQGEGTAFNQWDWSREMYVTDERGFRSNKSWKGTRSVPTQEGDQGWTEWGFTKYFTSPVKKGGMIHVQSTFYLPLDFDCYAAWALKWLRFRQQTAGGVSGIGHQDVYLFNEDSNWWPTPIGPKGSITHIQEGNAIGANGWTKTAGVIDLGQWITFEYQTTLDNVPVDQGGQGRTRVWYGPAGGQLNLLMDKTSAGTLDYVDSEYNLFYIFGGTWNNVPAVLTPFTPQTAYISETYITTRENELTKTDAAGNKIIGF